MQDQSLGPAADRESPSSDPLSGELTSTSFPNLTGSRAAFKKLAVALTPLLGFATGCQSTRNRSKEDAEQMAQLLEEIQREFSRESSDNPPEKSDQGPAQDPSAPEQPDPGRARQSNSTDEDKTGATVDSDIIFDLKVFEVEGPDNLLDIGEWWKIAKREIVEKLESREWWLKRGAKYLIRLAEKQEKEERRYNDPWERDRRRDGMEPRIGEYSEYWGLSPFRSYDRAGNPEIDKDDLEEHDYVKTRSAEDEQWKIRLRPRLPSIGDIRDGDWSIGGKIYLYPPSSASRFRLDGKWEEGGEFKVMLAWEVRF